MIELNYTTANEPLPVFSCEHIWMNIGCPLKIWMSADTSIWMSIDTNANIGNPLAERTMQKRQCLKCGGYEWVPV